MGNRGTHRQEFLHNMNEEELLDLFERAMQMVDDIEMSDDDFEKIRQDAKKLLDKTVKMYYK